MGPHPGWLAAQLLDRNKSMIDESKLNDYSGPIAAALFAAFPELRSHARIDPNERVDPGSLMIEFPRPAGAAAEGLWISTHDNEITVGFDQRRGAKSMKRRQN